MPAVARQRIHADGDPSLGELSLGPDDNVLPTEILHDHADNLRLSNLVKSSSACHAVALLQVDDLAEKVWKIEIDDHPTAPWSGIPTQSLQVHNILRPLIERATIQVSIDRGDVGSEWEIRDLLWQPGSLLTPLNRRSLASDGTGHSGQLALGGEQTTRPSQPTADVTLLSGVSPSFVHTSAA